jgi:two-component system chemotaxis sensor kinase CheA
MDMNEIKEIFFQECEEQLAELESGLLRLNDGDTDPETVNAVFAPCIRSRVAREPLVSMTLSLSLTCLRQHLIAFDPTSSKLRPTCSRSCCVSADVLADLTAASRDGGTVESSRTSGLVAELEALPRASRFRVPAARPLPLPPPSQRRPKRRPRLPKHLNPRMTAVSSRCLSALTLGGDGDDELAIEDGARSFTVRFKPRSDLYAKGNESVLILRELAKLGDLQVRCETDDLPSLICLIRKARISPG